MYRLIVLKYPKIALLLFSLVFSYFFFSIFPAQEVISSFGAPEELAAFIGGLMFAYGFTTPIATGFFITMNTSNVLVLAAIGGLGALLSDLIIFNLIRISFAKEFRKLDRDFKKDKLYMVITKSKLFKEFSNPTRWHFSHKIKIYALYAVSGLIIASPLPDELGIILLAGMTRIKQKKLAVISFVMNALGILVMLSL